MVQETEIVCPVAGRKTWPAQTLPATSGLADVAAWPGAAERIAKGAAASAGMSFAAKRILQIHVAKTMEGFGCDGRVVFMEVRASGMWVKKAWFSEILQKFFLFEIANTA